MEFRDVMEVFVFSVLGCVDAWVTLNPNPRGGRKFVEGSGAPLGITVTGRV